LFTACIHSLKNNAVNGFLLPVFDRLEVSLGRHTAAARRVPYPLLTRTPCMYTGLLDACSKRLNLCHAMRLFCLLLLAVGTVAWAPALLAPNSTGRARHSGIVLRVEGGADAEVAIQKRLKMVLLEEEGRRRIERRERLEKMVDKDLALVRKYGGVSGTPGCMMGPPDLGA